MAYQQLQWNKISNNPVLSVFFCTEIQIWHSGMVVSYLSLVICYKLSKKKHAWYKS